MGDSVTPEIIGNMIRQYFSQERPEEETIQALGNAANLLIYCMMVILTCLRGFHFHQMSFLLRY